MLFKVIELGNSPKEAEETLNKTLDSLSSAYDEGIWLDGVKIVHVSANLWAFIHYRPAKSDEEIAEEMRGEIEIGRKKGLC